MSIPEVLFDRNAVWRALDDEDARRIGPYGVSLVLDAVVGLMKQAAEPAPAAQAKKAELDAEYERGRQAGIVAYYDAMVEQQKKHDAVRAQQGLQAPLSEQGWTDADADAARLALELECLLSDKDVPLPALSRWWDSAHEALQLHRDRMVGITATRGQEGEHDCS